MNVERLSGRHIGKNIRIGDLRGKLELVAQLPSETQVHISIDPHDQHARPVVSVFYEWGTTVEECY